MPQNHDRLGSPSAFGNFSLNLVGAAVIERRTKQDIGMIAENIAKRSGRIKEEAER